MRTIVQVRDYFAASGKALAAWKAEGDQDAAAEIMRRRYNRVARHTSRTQEVAVTLAAFSAPEAAPEPTPAPATQYRVELLVDLVDARLATAPKPKRTRMVYRVVEGRTEAEAVGTAIAAIADGVWMPGYAVRKLVRCNAR